MCYPNECYCDTGETGGNITKSEVFREDNFIGYKFEQVGLKCEVHGDEFCA